MSVLVCVCLYVFVYDLYFLCMFVLVGVCLYLFVYVMYVLYMFVCVIVCLYVYVCLYIMYVCLFSSQVLRSSVRLSWVSLTRLRLSGAAK